MSISSFLGPLINALFLSLQSVLEYIAATVSFGTLGDKDKAKGMWEEASTEMSKYIDAVKDATKATSEKSKADDLIKAGHEMTLALFNTMKDWAGESQFPGQEGSTAGHGSQVDMSKPRREDGPSLANVTMSPTMRDITADFVDSPVASPGNMDDPTYPRPSAAAINMRLTDVVEIKVQDEDRLHQELLLWKQQLLNTINSIQDHRWMKIARARLSHGITRS